MKKIEKEIKAAKKIIEKLSKKDHFESNDLKALAISLDSKTDEISDDLKEISELKITLKDKIKKFEIRKSEFEYLLNGTNKLVQSESKEQAKSKKDAKESTKKKTKVDKVEKKTKAKKGEKQEVKTYI
jgi:hypothetical protein